MSIITIIYFIFFIEMFLLYKFSHSSIRKIKKRIKTDLFLGVLFFFTTGIFFSFLITEFGGLSGDGGAFLYFLFHVIINGFFILKQTLLSRSINNQKILFRKKRCFLIHITILFSPFLSLAYHTDIEWIFYIIFFAFVSYKLFNYLYLKIVSKF